MGTEDAEKRTGTGGGNSITAKGSTKKSGTVGTATAKSDHGEPVGFFENFRRQIASLGRRETVKSQGVIDHIDQVDLMDLAADLGCISAEEQSFTFKPDNNTSSSNHLKGGQKEDLA